MSADDWETDDADADWPDDDDGETLTIPCPFCKADIYEESEQCPHCGEYVVRSSTAWNGKPIWWIILGILGIIAMMFARAGR